MQKGDALDRWADFGFFSSLIPLFFGGESGFERITADRLCNIAFNRRRTRRCEAIGIRHTMISSSAQLRSTQSNQK